MGRGLLIQTDQTRKIQYRPLRLNNYEDSKALINEFYDELADDNITNLTLKTYDIQQMLGLSKYGDNKEVGCFIACIEGGDYLCFQWLQNEGQFVMLPVFVQNREIIKA